MMKNIIEKFQICLVLSALLFSSFVAACSGNDDTVTPEITIPANILTDGMTFSKTGGNRCCMARPGERSGGLLCSQ